MNQGTSNGQLKDRRPTHIDHEVIKFKAVRTRLNSCASMETILRDQVIEASWQVSSQPDTTVFYLSKINTWEKDHAFTLPKLPSHLIKVVECFCTYWLFYNRKTYDIWKQADIVGPVQSTITDQRTPFTHVFIHSLIYMKFIEKWPTGKIFLQYKSQGMNISNINKTTENQQEKGKK